MVIAPRCVMMPIPVQVDNDCTGMTTYSYDAAGRLASVTNDQGTTITYTYDKSGNLLKRQNQ